MWLLTERSVGRIVIGKTNRKKKRKEDIDGFDTVRIEFSNYFYSNYKTYGIYLFICRSRFRADDYDGRANGLLTVVPTRSPYE